MINGRMHIGERADRALRRGPAAGADGRRAFRPAAPAALQLVQGRVKFAPLAAGEKSPFQGILQAVVILARPRRAISVPVRRMLSRSKNAVMPGAVVGPLADQPVQLAASCPAVIGSLQP